MTDYFVSSVDGSNANTGLAWTVATVPAAKATIAGALAAAAAGDRVFVDSAHNFTATAAITWTPPTGGIAIISVTRSGTTGATPWLAGATESVGAASAAFTVAGAAGSSMFIDGVTFTGGTGTGAACDILLLPTSSVASYLEMRNCTLTIPAAVTTAQIVMGVVAGSASRSLDIRLDGCSLIASGSRAGTFITFGDCAVKLINPMISTPGATKPVVLFEIAALPDTADVLVCDGDLSGYAVSGGAYLSVTNCSASRVVFENLKLSGTPTLISGTWPGGAGSLTTRNCDSADITHGFQFLNAYGTLTADNTIYLTSGGARFDGAGISWKIITTSQANEYTPFVAPIMEIWGATLTAQTAEIEIVHDSAIALTDRDAWTNTDYISSSAFPIGTLARNRNANPFTGTPANVPSSSNTWTGTGGFGNPNKQKFQHTFTPAAAGLITAELKIGMASKTLYVAPVINGVT